MIGLQLVYGKINVLKHTCYLIVHYYIIKETSKAFVLFVCLLVCFLSWSELVDFLTFPSKCAACLQTERYIYHIIASVFPTVSTHYTKIVRLCPHSCS